jgi:hypothetical protein
MTAQLEAQDLTEFPESRKVKVNYSWSHHRQMILDVMGRSDLKVDGSGKEHDQNYIVGWVDDEGIEDLKKEGMTVQILDTDT